MRAVITIPVRDQVNGALRSALEGAGLPWLPVYGMSDLPRARSVLLTLALRDSNADRILCIDADIVPTVEQIHRLAQHPRVDEQGAVTGLYSLRSGKGWACYAPEEIPNDAGIVNERLPWDGCRRAEGAGLGFACISRASLLRVRDMLPRLVDPELTWWPFCVPFIEQSNGTPEYRADDWSLWRRLATSGTQLWADPALVVGHQALVTLMQPTV